MADKIGDLYVDVHGDASGVEADIRRQLRKIADDLGNDFSERLADAVRRNLRATLSEALDDISRDLRDSLHIDVDVDDLHARERVRDFVDDASSETINIPVDTLTAPASAKLAYVTRPRFVQIIPRLNQRALAQVTAALGALSGLRLAWRWTDRVTSFLKNLDTSLPLITALSTGITTLVGAIAAAGGGLVTVAADLASIWPLILAAPGLIAQLGWSIGALIPALSDAGDELAVLKDDFTALGDLISDNFWDRARQPIIDLVQQVMPSLRDELGKVSTAYGGLAAAFANSFAEAEKQRGLAPLFAGLADSINTLATGTDHYVSILYELGSIGERYLPRLSQWIVDISTRFDNWLTSAANSGELDAMLDNALETVKLIGSALYEATRILIAIDDAAERAGGGGLRSLVEALRAVADTMSTPEFQIGLATFLRASEDAIGELLPVLGALGDLFYDLRGAIAYFVTGAGATFGTLLTGIVDALNQPEVGEGLRDFIDGLLEGVQALVPYLPEVADGFASILSFIGDVGAAFGPVLGSALAALAPVLTNLFDALSPLVDLLAGAATDALHVFTANFEQFATDTGDLGSVIAGFLVSGFKAVQSVAPTLIGVLKDTLVSVIDQAPTIMEGLVDAISEVGPILLDAVQEVLSALILQLPTIIDGLLTAVSNLLPSLIENLLLVLQALGAAVIQLLPILVEQIFNLLTGLIQGFVDALPLLVERAKELWPQVIASLTESIPAMLDAGLQFFLAVSDALITVGPTIVQGWLEILPVIMQALVDNAPAFLESAKEFFLSMVTAMTDSWPQIITALSEALPDFIDALVDFLPQMLDAGIDLFLMLVDAVIEATPQIIDALQKATPKLIDALIKATPQFLDAGRQLILGLISGIGQMGLSLANAARNLALRAVEAIKDALGIHSPSTVMRDEIGKMMGAGISVGLADSTAGVAAAFGSLLGNSIDKAKSELSGLAGTSVLGSSSTIGRDYGYTVEGSGQPTTNITVEEGAVQVPGGDDPKQVAEEAMNRLAEKVGRG